MTPREAKEALEEKTLSPYATLSKNTAGRGRPLDACPLRTDFCRDRDRIVHSKSFRRLMHKTQVFLSPEGDHYRTRLTHTLEVSQIARTVAVALGLNEDLTEACALGHDLGHTPFGHAGERALSTALGYPFVHAAQSVRVVTRLEREGRGLNLTAEVIDGIACHSTGQAKTLEGRVVRFADKMAYLTHDIDDSIRGGIIGPGDIPWDLQYTLGRTTSERLSTMISSLVENSGADIAMAPEIYEAFLGLRTFMFEAVYVNSLAKSEEGRAEKVVQELYRYFLEHTGELPSEYISVLAEEGPERAVCDYISGMSDRYATASFQRLFIPKCWGV